MRFFLVILFFLATAQPLLAQRYTISGHVGDAETGEKLIGVHLYVPALEAGTVTNRYGFYSLTLPADSVALVVSYIGFTPRVYRLRLQEDVTLDIDLVPAAVQAGEVEIVAERVERIEETTRMSTISVPIAQIQSMPALLGEVDVLKALQMLPGIQSGSEGTSGLYVRGGGPDQNLILLDGVPVYNASHLFGFFSVFNSDAIQNVEVIKGGFPARYGGRLSSVIEIGMKEGNMRKFRGQGSIGLIASRLTLEGPLVKNRTSFVVSGRRTYIDLLARPLINRQNEGTSGYYFYDLNGKINHVLSRRDRVFLSVYTGDDRFYHREERNQNYTASGLGWGNITAALRWNRVLSRKTFSNTTLTYSRYQFGIEAVERFRGADQFRLQYFSGIRDWSARIDVDYLPDPRHTIRFGGSGIAHTFSPGAAHFRIPADEVLRDTVFAPTDPIDALQFSAYAEDDLQLGRRLKANLGLHGAAFVVGSRTYRSLQPRLAVRYQIAENMSLKASFVDMHQYIHLLTNSGLGLPTDLWLPATDRVPPQRSRQVAAGIARSLRGGGYDLSVEGYHKQMWNLIEYREGANFLNLDEDWQSMVTVGKGLSYGAELFLQKRTGRTTGWVGYTLSWTTREFEELNEGRPFPYKYDRRHDVGLTVAHRLSDRWEVAANWVFGTGNAITLPLARYQQGPANLGSSWYDDLYLYSDRNAHRMRSYHRMDVGVSRHRTTSRGGERTLNLSFYNAYSRRNPFYMYIDREGDRTVAKQISLFPILPSVSYSFKF